MSGEIHLNDIGTDFRIEIDDTDGNAVDISAATTKNIIFKKPGGTTVTQTASFVTDGSDGLISYTVVDGDLDEIGTWKIQAKIIAPNGTWKTNFTSFRVYRNI